ncbi:NUDIX domain-containing protein [Streptomyces sp. NPDC050560]|uniref:NUDIX domain-containing protein n=1 Tax=Streptomyces sp. NPDC050560 TaxID=3365630 RepID=UPI00379D5DF1
MGWTRTASEVLHRGRFLNLRQDSVRLPDGSPGTYEHVDVADNVRVVALDGAGRVLLVEDDFYLQGRRVPHLPGGGGEGQPPAVAAARELEEETGLVPGELRQIGVIDPLPATTAARTFLFLATGLRTGVMCRDAAECGMTMRWLPLSAAVAEVRAGRITEGGSVAALLLVGTAAPAGAAGMTAPGGSSCTAAPAAPAAPAGPAAPGESCGPPPARPPGPGDPGPPPLYAPAAAPVATTAPFTTAPAADTG